MEDSNYATSLPIIWHPVQSRITTFQPDDAMMDDWAQWWRQTFNDEPLQTETRPREQLRSVNGPVDHGIMVITDRPGRTDFVLQPHAGQPNAPLSPSDPTTPYSEIVNSIANPIKGWLQSRSTIYRLAVGAVLLSPSPDIHAVYAKLSTLLHSVELDGLTEPDFLYRVNRPRESVSLPGTYINRVTTWAIAQGQDAAFVPGVQSPQTSPIQYAAQLDLDINTRAEPSQVFEAATSIAILDELLRIGEEIAAQGEKP